VRHGRRAAAPGLRRFRDFAHFGLREECEVATNLAQRPADEAERAGDVTEAIAVGVPRHLGHGER
jgi:hypothetical protein